MAYWEYVDLRDVITKVEIKLKPKTKLIIGINTLLDIVSITSQDGRRGIF